MEVNIEFSKEELEEIHENCFWNCGGEGNIYRIPIGRHNILLKLFYIPFEDRFCLPKRTIENKEKKITLLRDMKLPNKVQVQKNIYLKNEFIGYALNEAENYQDFCFNAFSTYQRMEFLKRLRRELQHFHELGIIYGDLKSDNVLSHVSNYKLGCLCNLDNVQVKDYPIDLMSSYVDEFLYQYGDADENLDWYVLNLLTLESVYHLDRTTIEPYHETRAFMDHYRGNSDALRSMQHINSHYEGKLLLDDPTFYEEIDISYSKK